MCSADLNMATISGTTHIQMIFSFWTGTGKRFIGKALCSSDGSVTQLIHILHFVSINFTFTNPQKKNSDVSNLENGGAGEGVAVQNVTNTTEEEEWCTI
jgi:midasin (ATPase involved in ribosome maturation)